MFVLHNYIGALVWHFMLAFYGPMVNFMSGDFMILCGPRVVANSA